MGVPVNPAGRTRTAVCGSEEPDLLARESGVGLPERRDVVQDPESAAVGGDHHVVSVHVDVAHRGHREVELEGLPGVAAVERDVHALLGAGVKEAGANGVLAQRVDEAAAGNAR